MIVLDASVAIKILTREPGSDAALGRIVPETDRLAPDWIKIEVANALARKVRDNGLSERAAMAGRTSLPMLITGETAALDLIDEAFELSLRLSHAVYDCLYLALARRERCCVVTHDADFARAVRRGGLNEYLELLT